MTDKEKAQAYDEAIKRAQEAANSGMVSQNFVDDIFQLRESENERIRKALVIMMKVPRKEIFEAQGITKEQALAYLERPKEPIDPFDTKLFQDGVKEGRRLEREDIMKEQQPAEWSEEDEKMIDKICHAILVSTYHEKGLTLSEMNQCQSWMHNLSQKAIWSNERDTWLISRALEYVNMSNENDELKKEIETCLKRRYPQSHWKPSEEQMKALYCALNDAISLYSDKVSPLYEEISRTHFDALESLYNDLKKLM